MYIYLAVDVPNWNFAETWKIPSFPMFHSKCVQTIIIFIDEILA